MASYTVKPTYSNKSNSSSSSSSSNSRGIRLPGVIGGIVSGIVNGVTSGSISIPKPSGGSSSSSSSSSSSGSSGWSGNRTQNGYYTDRDGNSYKLNANGTYTDKNGVTRFPYTSVSDIREGNSPYSDGKGNSISVGYRGGDSSKNIPGVGTYTLTDPTGKVIKRQQFNAYITGDDKLKDTPGYLYAGEGAKPLNTQLIEYVQRNYFNDDEDNSKNYTLEAANNNTQNATNQNTTYGFGQHPYDKIGNYNFPSVNTPQSQNTGGLGIYNGVTNNIDTYNKIQQMKNFSQMWAAYDDPNVRKQMALNAQMIGDTIPGAYRGTDGVWYVNNNERLYDTVYQPAENESIIPQGNFLSREDITAEYQAMADAQAAAREAQLSAILNELGLQRDDVNAAYDDMAREAYINSRQNEMNLPQQLAAQGITGGAAESTLLGLATNYENNLYDNEKSRQNQLASIANSEINAKLTADAEIAAMQAQANQAAFDAYLNQIAAQNAYNQWAFEVGQNMYNNDWQKQQAEREWAYNLANNAYLMSQQNRENSIADKNNTINWALATGDYSSLKDLGIDTSYLENTQKNTLLQLALEAERQKLANQAAQMQLASYSLPSYSSSSGSSSRSTSSSSRSSSSGSASGNVVSRNTASSNNRPTKSLSELLQNLVWGRNGELDPSTPNDVIADLMAYGKIRTFKGSDGTVKYYLIES